MNSVWEQRWHPLRGEWVLFTSHRGGRPWIGERKSVSDQTVPAYDPTCALCPGNARLAGHNPDYAGAWWFTNDLPCFGNPESHVASSDPLYQTRAATGTAEVVCYHPDHSRAFALLDDKGVNAVAMLWRDRTTALMARPDVEHVLIFENRGELVGTSNPHPHGQIYAGNLVYGHMAKADENAADHLARTGRPLGLDVLDREMRGGRVIAENAAFVACVPWFARYRYEVIVMPRRAVTSLTDLDDDETMALGAILREVAVRYDNLWCQPMPYIMAIHQAPKAAASGAAFPFHVEFHPPLRNPATLKYLAGPEVGGGSMTNESDPDAAAAELRSVAAIHYSRGAA